LRLRFAESRSADASSRATTRGSPAETIGTTRSRAPEQPVTAAAQPPDPTRRRGRLERLAAFTFRNRRLTVAAWVAMLAAVIAFAPGLAGEFSADYSAPGSDSREARELVQERFGGFSAETVDVVYEAPAGARSPEVERRMDRFVAEAQRLEGIGTAEPAQVSPDGSIAAVRLQLDRAGSLVPVETGERLIEMGEEASGRGLEIGLGGPPIMNAQGGPGPETTGLIGAMIVLLVVFGSLVAAGLPLAVALFGLGISESLIGVLAGIAAVPDWATAVAGLIGIGVGIDYALLVLTRFRSALSAGASKEDAVAEAVSTAGRSVIVAGGTVIISMLGLFLLGLSYMNGVALSASLAVLVVVAASVTLLPALLGFAGTHVNRLRLPVIGRRAQAAGDRGALASGWSRAVQRRPWTAIAAATALVLVLAVPALGLQLGFPDAGNDRDGQPTRVAYDLMAKGFGEGANAPLTVVSELSGPGAKREVEAAAREVRSLPQVAAVSPLELNEAGDTALMTVTPVESPQADSTEELVHELRDRVPGYVGGSAALAVDQSAAIQDRLPLFVGGVVGLSFLLLTAAFRAPVVALKAGVMNLLSVGAAFGVVALFAQGGLFGELIGIDREVPVPPFIPVMMFAILFGLSMDYEVFLLSRVREEYLKLRNTPAAVTEGLARTARVISAAAAIMVVVFMAFVVSDEAFLRLLGVGMATAILVDATVVRLVLVPAVMQVLGEANWWTPRWLARLAPPLEHEPARP
jgi:putative drug exporter of the RND superfamily